MEKRFVLFIVLSLAVLTGYTILKSMIAPKPPAVVDLDNDAIEEPPDDPDGAVPEAPTADTPPAEPAESEPDAPPSASTPGAGKAASERPEDGTASDTVVASPSNWPDRWISRGSYQPGDGPPILITWNARGATVERIELTARDDKGKLRYRELLDRSGYLGHLASTLAPDGGCRVNVVGQGTPAALAKDPAASTATGLQIGDVIYRVDGVQINTPADLKAFLGTTKPADSIRLEVHRPSGDTSTDVQLITTLDVHPLQLIQPERPFRADKSVALHSSSFLFSLLQLGDTKAGKGVAELDLGVSLRDDNWKMVPLENGVEFLMQVDAATGSGGSPTKLELVKRFQLGTPEITDEPTTPYHLDYDIEIRNLSDEPQRIAYRQDGPNGLPLEGFWYSNKLHPTMFYIAGARDVVWNTEARSGPEEESEVIQAYKHELVSCSEINKTATKAAKNGKSQETVLFATDVNEDGDRMPLYVAVDTQYFVTAMKPVSERQVVYDLAAAYVLGNLSDVPKAAKKSTNVSFHLDSQAIIVNPYDPNGTDDATFRQSFEIFAGPKVPELLATYDLQDCIYYGWFGAVSKLLAVVLHFFFGIVKNYGLAIVMLTVLVRSGMFPLSRKAAKNAAMMQALAPQMKKITEKYKEDMEKRAKAQQELFKKHNYNPFGGCWMMLVQLPIFIGLYRSLSVDINLRQSALIPGVEWCSNLAGPDMLFTWPELFKWSIFTELGMLGPYFNILPMFTVALFLIQQKLFTPPATDDQSRMQLTMMKYMTVFIGVMFFKVAAGLCLYFIASSLWGIAERKLLPKPKLAAGGDAGSEPLPAKPKPRLPKPKPRSPDNGKSRRQQPRSKKKRR
ncbi:MAG: membrane protein insertase YidC [Pirellulaceae bacterium]|nr:membrane protein insertase YidC [Pirellulaceae bacterium]